MAKQQYSDVLSDFDATEFTDNGVTRTVYRMGTGPGVVIMSEVPGITPKVADFARRVVDLGCSVAMPSLFGVDGQPTSYPAIASTFARVCVSREFTVLAKGQSSPAISWLRALGKDLHQRCGGPGVGAVGMCLTGGFAMAMMLDEEMIAPVLSQPALPLSASKAHRAAIAVSPEELKIIKERVDAGVCVLGLRFTHDPLSPGDRFETLRRELGDGFVGVEIDSSPGNEHGFPKDAHSVLTEHLVDEPGNPTHDALHQVLDLFREKLL